MAEYEEYQEYDEYYDDEPQGGSRTWLIVAIVVAVVLLCCCCLAIVAGFALAGEDILNALEDIAGIVPDLKRMTAFV
jgi:hypothetical protein